MAFSLPVYRTPDFSAPRFASAPDVRWEPVDLDGVAPRGFHSTSMHPEYLKMDGAWVLVEELAMDDVIRLRPDGSLEVVPERSLRVGDLQLVVNLEGRFPIVSIFEGAVFADMGNVWLMNASDQYPGGELKWGEILEEIAVGIGLGLRANVSIATLRVDFGIPLYDPGYDAGQRWRPAHWKFSNIVTNFGINYPF